MERAIKSKIFLNDATNENRETLWPSYSNMEEMSSPIPKPLTEYKESWKFSF
jgi:hypothetical protein